jgi:hypothetical protein
MPRRVGATDRQLVTLRERFCGDVRDNWRVKEVRLAGDPG